MSAYSEKEVRDKFLRQIKAIANEWSRYENKSNKERCEGVAFSILLMLIFDFTEKVSFVHQFNIPVGLTRRIPLSTVLLAVGVLALLIKALITGKVKMIEHPFIRSFLFACGFLVILMALFYPFLYRHYQIILSYSRLC